jgi:RND family efflux transporter MFP subunit
MKFFKKRSNLVITGIVLAAIIGGAWYFTQPSEAEEATPELQTAKVRTGDLVITANGAGTVLPSEQIELGFRTSGVVTEVNATLGQQVKAGDILARLDDVDEQLAFAQAEINLNALFTPAGIAEYQIDWANSQDAYDTTLDTLQYYISPEVYYWEVKVGEAQQTLDLLNADPKAAETAKADAQKALERARNNLKAAEIRYINEYAPYYFPYTWIDEETGEEITEVVPPSPSDVTLARATVEQAKMALTDAQTALEMVESGDRALLEQSLASADGTALAKIKAIYLDYENARLALESVQLVAPFDGTVIALNMVKGQTVGTSPVITIATTERLMVRFYLDETDVSKAVMGSPVVFTFDAYPDATVTGEIILVEPALQIVDGTPVVVVWAKLPLETESTILSGMTVEVEVIAAEARNALIVPVQALRELTPGSHAVFVVQADGSLKMTPVTVGLRDFANAEILSGLKVGDVISTGTVETK